MVEGENEMRVLVTGNKGFIGHHLIKFLEAKGHNVRGADMEIDLRNPNNALISTMDCDWVFNLAALNGNIEFTTNHKEIIHNNALVNLNMAQACKKNKVKRVFFSSSACVYPVDLQDANTVYPLSEEDAYPANCDTEYGWEKLFAEHIWLTSGLDVRIARYFNIYGPEGNLDPLYSKAPLALTQKVLSGKDVKIWGDGDQKRSFLYIQDCLEATYALMESDITGPINIGSPDLMTINELVDLIAEVSGVEVNKTHQLDKVQGVRTRHSDNTKAKELLNWERKVEPREGLREVIKWIKSL